MLGVRREFSTKGRAVGSWILDHFGIYWPCTAFTRHKGAALQKQLEQGFSVAHMFIWLEPEL